LAAESKKYGFSGRFGGDEFLGIFEGMDADGAKAYLDEVNKQAGAYNSLQVNEIEKLSFAAGFSTGYLKYTGIDDLINEADRNMYANKRAMKKAGN
jgi:GGDEF domain-containing protein